MQNRSSASLWPCLLFRIQHSSFCILFRAGGRRGRMLAGLHSTCERLVDSCQPCRPFDRSVAQLGQRTCFGCKGSLVRIQPLRLVRCGTAWRMLKELHGTRSRSQAGCRFESCPARQARRWRNWQTRRVWAEGKPKALFVSSLLSPLPFSGSEAKRAANAGGTT